LIFINILIFILAAFGNLGSKLWKQFVFIQILIFAVFFGLRNEKVGVDTFQYMAEFSRGKGGYFREPIFKFIGFFLFRITKEPLMYILTISLLSGFFAYSSFKILKIKKEIIPLITWVFLSNTMVIFNWINGLRQGLASMVLFFSIALYSCNKRKRATTLLVTSPLYHFSAMVFIGQQLLYKAEKKIRIINIIRSDNIIIDIFCLILAFVAGKAASFIPFLGARYVYTSKTLLIKICIALFFYFITKYFLLRGKTDNHKIWFDTYFFILCLSVFFTFNTDASNRFLYYSGLFESIILGLVLSSSKKNRIPYLALLILGNFVYFFFTILTSAYANMFKF
jgi:hypothetical protein